MKDLQKIRTLHNDHTELRFISKTSKCDCSSIQRSPRRTRKTASKLSSLNSGGSWLVLEVPLSNTKGSRWSCDSSVKEMNCCWNKWSIYSKRLYCASNFFLETLQPVWVFYDVMHIAMQRCKSAVTFFSHLVGLTFSRVATAIAVPLVTLICALFKYTTIQLTWKANTPTVANIGQPNTEATSRSLPTFIRQTLAFIATRLLQFLRDNLFFMNQSHVAFLANRLWDCFTVFRS